MKKILSLFLSVLMLTSVVAAVDLSAYAASSGSCGTNVTYTLEGNTLTISGTGDMTDYYDDTPWYSDRNLIEDVIINSGVTSIGDYSFQNCTSLTSITIPDSVTSISVSVFIGCTSLTSITVDSKNSYYSSSDGVLFNKDKTELVCYPEGKSGAYTIPNSVTSIGNYAFRGCGSLTSVTIPDSVTSIGDHAFGYCESLTSVTIGNGVTSIGYGAFEDCRSLTSITIPDSVTSIGNYAFEDCTSLTSVTIGNSVTSIGIDAFGNCTSLTSVTIGNSVASMGNNAFDSCTSLTSVTIPNSVTSIGDCAFDYCTSLTSITVGSNNTNYSSEDGVLFNKDKTELICCPGGKTGAYTIPNSVKSIGDYAFCYCTSLTSVTIGNSVTSIGNQAFYRCTSLTSVTIPNSVTSIGYCAFKYCTSLTSVTIPNSVTSIGYCAFENCESLTDVYYSGSESDWNKIDIDEDNEYLTNATAHYNATTSTTCKTHTWDSGKTTTKATCAKTGVKTYTCTVCGATKTEKIAKKSHSWEVKTKGSATNKKSGSYKCKNCSATKKLYYPKTMSLSTTSYTYNAKTKKPSVTIKDSNGSKISSKYYTVSYISQSTGKKVSSMKNPGKYYVKVTFKTRYSGSIKKAVTIKPKKTSIKKITASKKGFTVKWGKVSTQNTGYQIQYSTSKSFKNAKTATVKKTGTTSKKVTKLKAKKKYYVRVRTYKTVKVNGKNTKIYSAWSSAKGVTTKK